MIIRCPNCQKTFNANYEQKSLVESAIKKNMRLVFIKCPECYQNVPINPSDLLSKVPQKDADKKDNNQEVIECPICLMELFAILMIKMNNFGDVANVGIYGKLKTIWKKTLTKKGVSNIRINLT